MTSTSMKKPRTQRSATAETPRQPDKMSGASRRYMVLWLAGMASVVLGLTIYVLRLDHTVGLIVDDAWYVLLAKALAKLAKHEAWRSLRKHATGATA